MKKEGTGDLLKMANKIFGKPSVARLNKADKLELEMLEKVSKYNDKTMNRRCNT